MNRNSVAGELFRLLGRHPAPDPGPERWQQLLDFADRTHLTLHLRGLSFLPTVVGKQVEERWIKNQARRKRLRESYEEIANQFSARGISCVLLKGFTHETGFGLPCGVRVQSDLDFLVKPDYKARASAALRELGYQAHGPQNLSAEHDRPWVRPFQWTWRGDYFDPDMPVPVELHDSPWSPAADRIQCPGLEEFWHRRISLAVSGMNVPAFAELDRIAFAALHALRHILRNDARPAHVLELARLLETRIDHDELWDQWAGAHHPEVRQLQVVAFRFAEEWFGCRLPKALARECTNLPEQVQSWLHNFAWSPVRNLTQANKDVLWLHLALVGSRLDRWKLAARRLFPLKVPHELPQDRFRYHASALLPALSGGVRWWFRRTTSSTISHTSD